MVLLRNLLFNQEITTIGDLRSRLDALSEKVARFKELEGLVDPKIHAAKVGDVLAEAMHLRSSKDNNLSIAMEPIVDGIVKTSLRDKMPEFINAMFPLMGPSIRKSIAESFRSMMEGFSKSMEMAFSLKGLRWRLEALRTGKAFSEIVLLHTLVYRVEQVLFIHSATGISIEHVANEGVDSQDAGMVSAMLTAMQDFVQDCLSSSTGDDLESMQHGEHIFMVEKSPVAYIACIVRGTPPASFREQMHICLETLLIQYSAALEDFNGDTAPFITCRPYLEKLLADHYVDEGKPAPVWSKALVVLILLAVIGGLGFLKYKSYQNEVKAASLKQDMYTAVDFLRHEPGIEVTYINEKDNDPWEVYCLQDRLARNPSEILREHSVDPSKFNFKINLFNSHEAVIVERNVKQILNPPESVKVILDANGILTLSGTAYMDWILMARNKAIAVPGVTDVDMSRLSDPRMTKLKDMAELVESVQISFPLNSDAPYPEEKPKLDQVIDLLVALEHLADSMGLSVSLTIYGHTDSTGTDRRNYELSQARARAIAAMLYNRESTMPVFTYGIGADSQQGARIGSDPSRRKIEMRLRFTGNAQELMENFKF
ncbi:MAG: OmpA family protein [Deltaproteobacteria bacterium]|nr:OmpA family protein [Deltaproteobacteria bacterium]